MSKIDHQQRSSVMLHLSQDISHTVLMADSCLPLRGNRIAQWMAFSFAEIVQNNSGEANTRRSAAFILGTSSEKPSFCTHGFPYRQVLHPMQLFTSTWFNDTSSTSYPASTAPWMKASANCLVFPFGRPPPNITNILFMRFSSFTNWKLSIQHW